MLFVIEPNSFFVFIFSCIVVVGHVVRTLTGLQAKQIYASFRRFFFVFFRFFLCIARLSRFDFTYIYFYFIIKFIKLFVILSPPIAADDTFRRVCLVANRIQNILFDCAFEPNRIDSGHLNLDCDAHRLHNNHKKKKKKIAAEP